MIEEEVSRASRSAVVSELHRKILPESLKRKGRKHRW